MTFMYIHKDNKNLFLFVNKREEILYRSIEKIKKRQPSPLFFFNERKWDVIVPKEFIV